jgi:hypothetical protein
MNKHTLSIALAALLLAPAAFAQTAVSTFNLTVASTTATPAQTGFSEAITFSGVVHLTATVATDPVLPPQVVLSIDGREVVGKGAGTTAAYKNECEANLTRPFTATDVVQLTCAVFKDGPGSYLNAKTGVLTFNLTYDTTTKALTKVTASMSAMPTANTVAAVQ